MKKEKAEYTFNLVDEKWIPVRTLNGELLEVSIKEALLRAGTFRAIEDGSPLVTISLYRFLLAILHRALEGPADIKEAASWYKDGFPEKRIETYIDKWHDRFDLFHPEHPFYQVTGFPDSDLSYWTILGTEYSSKNNKLLFDHSYDTSDQQCAPNVAAKLLLAFQTFALGGGKSSYGLSNYTNAPSASAAFILPQDVTLHRTLALGLVSYPPDIRKGDLPIWEKKPTSLKSLKAEQARPCRGVTDLYTWMSRALLLRPEQDQSGSRIQVKQLNLGSGFSLNNEDSMDDPMLAYRVAAGDYRAVALRADRAFWRDFSAILPSAPTTNEKAPLLVRGALSIVNGNAPVEVSIFGLVNDKAKVFEWRREHYTLPSAITSNEEVYELVGRAITSADETQKSLNRAVWNLATNLLSLGERSPDKADVEKVRDGFSHNLTYWPHMERAFHSLLSELKPGHDEEQLWGFWQREQINAIHKAWATVELSAGDDAKALRAISKAARAISARINELKGTESEGEDAA